MTAYDDLRNVLEGYNRAEQLYKQIAHFPLARKEAAQFARDENDQAAEQILRNPDTPIEKVAEALGISSQRKYQKLEDLVENKFSEILNSKEIKEDRLVASLLSYLPKDNVLQKYKELAEAHNVLIKLGLYENKEKAKPEDVKAVLSEMADDVIEHYKNKYKANRGDSKEVREQKEIIKGFFLSLYVRDNKPVGEAVFIKYQEIHEDKLKKFQENLKTKPALIKYIQATLPEDKEFRIDFLGRLVSQKVS